MKNYNSSIDLLIALVVEEIAKDENQDPSLVLPEFINSNIAKMLYKEETKLWWEGSSFIAQKYKEEKNQQN